MKQQANKQLKNPVRNSTGRILSLCCFLSAPLMGLGTFAYADQFADAAKGAAEGIQASASGATRWIIAGVMVIIGLIFLVGTQQQKEATKGGIFIKLIGVACILCAIPVAGIVFGWFK